MLHETQPTGSLEALLSMLGGAPPVWSETPPEFIEGCVNLCLDVIMEHHLGPEHELSQEIMKWLGAAVIGWEMSGGKVKFRPVNPHELN